MRWKDAMDLRNICRILFNTDPNQALEVWEILRKSRRERRIMLREVRSDLCYKILKGINISGGTSIQRR